MFRQTRPNPKLLKRRRKNGFVLRLYYFKLKYNAPRDRRMPALAREFMNIEPRVMRVSDAPLRPAIGPSTPK